MAYAIIKTGGKQHKVAVGDKLDFDKLTGASGDTAVFNEVLLYSKDGDIRIGDPVLEGAKVTGKVLNQHRGPKVIAFKYKKRKGYHKTIGSRRHLTRVQIETITI